MVQLSWIGMLLAALSSPRLFLCGLRPAALVNNGHEASTAEITSRSAVLARGGSTSKVTFRPLARRFAACLSRDDVDLKGFIKASEEFVQSIEKFGDFTSRGVNDARKNLRRVQKAAGSRFGSMRALLTAEAQRGARKPGGGPASSSGAEALLWSRLSLSLWVEIFKEHLRSRSKVSLGDAFRNGFQRSIARYFDRFSRAAFAMASSTTPDWNVVRERTQLGCENGVCSDEKLTSELRTFVKDVEPVLLRMVELQKAVGLEDPRTP